MTSSSDKDIYLLDFRKLISATFVVVFYRVRANIYYVLT